MGSSILTQKNKAEMDKRSKIETAYRLSQGYFEYASTSCLITDCAGVIVEANRAARKLLGETEEALTGRSLMEWVIPDQRGAFLEFLSTFPQLSPDSEPLEVQYHFQPSQGEPFDTLVAVRALSSPKEKLDHLVWEIRAISRSISPQTALPGNAPYIFATLRHFAITVFTQDTDLRYTWVYNPVAQFVPEIYLGKTDADLLDADEAQRVVEIKRRALETGTAFHSEVTMTRQGETFYYDMTVEPLRGQGGKVVGLSGVMADVSERKRAQEALIENEERFRRLSETTSAAILVVDRDARIRFANPAVQDITGYSPEEILQMRLSELVDPTARQSLMSDLESQWQSWESLPSRDLHIFTKDGQERWIYLTAGKIEFDRFPAWVLTAFDITERDQAERVLRLAKQELEQRVAGRTAEYQAANQRLRAVLNALPVAVWIADADGHVIETNENAKQIWAGSISEAVNISDYGRYHAWRTDSGEPVRAEDWALARAVVNGETTVGEVLDIERFDGSRGTILTSAAPILNDAGKVIGGVAISSDISKQRFLEQQAQGAAMEAQIRAEELDAIFNAIADAVIVYDAQGEPLHANPAAMEMLGKDILHLDRDTMIDRLMIRIPDGPVLKMNELPTSRALTDEVAASGRFQYTNIQGDDRIVNISATPLYLDGRVMGVVTIWHDITERERLLAELNDERARLSAIFDNAPEAIIMIDEKGRVVLSNPAASHLNQQVNGWDLVHPVDPALAKIFHPDGTSLRKEEFPLLRAIRSGETQADLEVGVQIPDGQMKNLLISTAPILTGSGRIGGAVGLIQDITLRKQAEEKMHEEAARAEVLATLSQAFAEAGLYYPGVLATVSQRIAESFGDACTIRLVSDDGLWLDPVAFHHPDPDILAAYRKLIHGKRQSARDGLAGQVLQTGQAQVLTGITEERMQELFSADYADVYQKYPIQSALFVPLRVRNRLIGILNVIRMRDDRPFSIEDQIFFQELADRAALAIENARLYLEEAQRVRELDALHNATAMLLTTLDLDVLLERIMEAAQSAIPGAESGALYLVDPETRKLQIRAFAGYRDKDFPLMAPHGKDYPAKVVSSKKPILIRDSNSDRTEVKSDQARSLIVVPLMMERKAIGALSLTASQPGVFSTTDLNLLVSFAATTTAAIQNARLHAQVQRLATTDTLTEVSNRRQLFILGQKEVERFMRFGHPLSVMMLDIDHFKEINDTLGHTAGDQVLRTFAERCRRQVRQVDVIGRYGGDEFAILLPETSLEVAREVAERIRRAASDTPITTDQGSVTISISLGIARAVEQTVSISLLLDRADNALYAAKQRGGNRVEMV